MGTKSSKKFLYIGDDRSLLLIVKQILDKAYGPQTLEFLQASTGEEGLRIMQREKPDIVLVDIHMPGMNVFEVCQRIRPVGLNSAVILMSAYDSQKDNAAKAREAGADAYLAKPIKKGELLFVVNFALRLAHLADSVHEKNLQLEGSLGQLKQIHKKLAGLNEELRIDKRRLGTNLKEMTELNQQLEGKNDQISSMNGELAGRFDSAESLLSSIIELHQIQHRGHSERVSDASVYIARKMQLADYQIMNIKSAARLHELGIVALPTQEKRDEAIDEGKSRPFTHHPLVGEMLLKGFPGFEIIAEIIRHLHENVNGTGFPDQLFGELIPIGSRIVSAVSYFDHFRVSNPQLSASVVLEKMERQTGTLFDENVFHFLVEYIEAKETNGGGVSMECSVFALTEGMELASNIYSQSGINLLRRGTILDKDIVDKILKFHNMDPIAGAIKVKIPS